MITKLIGTFVIIVYLLYIYYKYVLYNLWQKRKIFCVKPVVPVGNLTSLVIGKLSIGEVFLNVYLKYKACRVFGLYTFFKSTLIITDPDAIQTVLTKEFKCFQDRGVFCDEKIDPMSTHLFSMSGQKWHNLRYELTPYFNPRKIKHYFMIMKECSEELQKSLESKARKKDCIEIKDIFERYTIDIIMAAAFGIKANCIKQQNSEFKYWGKQVFGEQSLWKALLMFTPNIMNFFSVPFTDRKTNKFFKELFEENMDYRRNNNINIQDFMNVLIQIMERGYIKPNNEKDGESSDINRLTISEAAAQAFGFFLAGYETSATTMTYCLYELACNPCIQNKVRNEIEELLQTHDEITYETVNEMDYLQKVINETLRKYPPLSILFRMCTEDVDLAHINIHVSKGTIVTIPVLGLHRDPAIYPDPDKFDPERFNEDNKARRHSFAYLPFGQGPRMCMGMKFAFVQIKMIIAKLLLKYKFKPHPRTLIPLKLDETSIMIVTAKGGVYLTIEQR